jgi:hypothetical protein
MNLSKTQLNCINLLKTNFEKNVYVSKGTRFNAMLLLGILEGSKLTIKEIKEHDNHCLLNSTKVWKK